MKEEENQQNIVLILKKKNGERKEVGCIESKGKNITDKESILHKINEYYYNLYKDNGVTKDSEYECYLYNDSKCGQCQ